MNSLAIAYPFWRLSAFRPLHRLLLGPPRHSSGITASASSNGVPVPAPVDRIRQANFDLLAESLEMSGNPSRVWANYINLLTFLGYERLPVEVHQQVLRKCTPPSRQLRVSAARRLFAGNFPHLPHMYEGRFQTVIRNIRSSGGQPTLDDYNFILEQFAAVGHHFGAMQVYNELTKSCGLVPRTKTFGLCLQAIAHRLTLPVAPRDKPRRVAVTRRMVSDLVNAMKSLNIPFTSVNLDLTMRILKETTDMQSFETLMRWGYGIDLANPDCPPLEYLETGSATDDTDTQPAVQRPTPQPFSTAALNMTIETLGRLNNISRMVQAFEVLTTPLPQQPSAYDEDDDDDFGESTSPSTFVPPSAPPNTTTYNILLRHLSQAGHAVFARHYLLQAIQLEKQVSHELRHKIGNMPMAQVPAPHFAINRGTLLSVFGDSNRDKNAGLMRWLSSRIPYILQKKQGQLRFYNVLRSARQRKKIWPYEEPSADAVPQLSSYPKKGPSRRRSAQRADRDRSAQPPRARDQPTNASAATIMERWDAPRDVGAVFELDLESDEDEPTFAISKTFNLDLHIQILERDISEIQALRAHIRKIFERTTLRIKERLGRRVSRGKSIYLLTDGDRRRRVSPEHWAQIARIRPTGRSSLGSLAERRVVLPWSEPRDIRSAQPSAPTTPLQSEEAPIQTETR
ncbi:hypothetical protein B0H15DRAFT_828481 [Mycena belliarum]|uniref:Uncharacterized protein n=1 Tax=Mycena belliarum TaxID=1033014 RepID=A0AAD6UE16_9AGAR|nr:hypothetical protein B0H15DRAFT_828481 [Mycena belliae]